MSPQTPCPICKELIFEGALKCRHCGEVVNLEYWHRTVERSALVEDIANALKSSNQHLLEASRLAGFLAAALLAATRLWAPGLKEPVITRVGMICLVVSILCAVGAHFFLGVHEYRAGSKLSKTGYKNHTDSGEMKVYMVRWPWFFGITQLVTLLSAIAIVCWVLTT